MTFHICAFCPYTIYSITRVFVIHFSYYRSNNQIRGRRFIAGVMAGTSSVSLTYPLDLVRARMAVTERMT